MAKKNIDFDMNGLFIQTYEPELLVGDARNLSFLEDNSIDLICAHPPYANIIHYTNHKEGDLSFFDIDGFLHEMEKVARESYRILKPGRHCAILIGDLRRHRYVIPLGFWLINVYLKVGFKLKELVIKRQHNCKTTGFWYKNSIKYNFLLLAHEYLSIFEKPKSTLLTLSEDIAEYNHPNAGIATYRFKKTPQELETTTVWIFPENKLSEFLNKNVILRYGGNNFKIIDITHRLSKTIVHQKKKRNMLFIRSPFLNEAALTVEELHFYLEKIKDIVSTELPFLNKNAFFIIQTKDVRINSFVEPVAKHIVDSLKYDGLKLKEIIIVSMENHCSFYKKQDTDSNLDITHEYLLVYEYRRT